MGDFQLMDSLQPFKELYEGIPDELFIKMMSFSFELKNLFEKIPPVCVFHNDATYGVVYHRL